jgi:hypothetical protein
VAEAVDRLELVPDGEEVPALERFEQVELQPVRVLELVDHDQGEALAPAAALGAVREQVAHAQLEVLEVDAGARGLGLRVRRGETGEQVVEEDERRAGVVVGARRPVPRPCLAVGLARLRAERLAAR